jgi:mono/diheme cytochrome c family protein
LIIKRTPYSVILVSLMVSACAANSPVPTEPTLAPFDELLESEGAPSAGSPAVDQTETDLPTEIQPQASPTVKISFANEVLPILQSRCIVCHGVERREQGLDLTSYSTLIAGSENGTIIVAGDAGNSLIVELVLTGRMPNRAPKLIPAQAQILIDWINQGAKDN